MAAVITRRGRFGRPNYYRGWRGGLARAIDATIELVSPKAAGVRRVQRMRNEAFLRFEAARIDRLRKKRSSGSADRDSLDDLPTMREQARAIARDDPHAKAIVKVLVDNVIGTGVRVEPAAKPETTGMTDRQTDQWNSACKELFHFWADEQADSTETQTFWGMQQLACRGLIVEGEMFGHRVLVPPERIPGRELAVSVETVDPDQVFSPGRSSFAEDRIRSGVERGERNQPIAYHIAKQHPDERAFERSPGRKETQRIRRFKGGLANVVHLYEKERSGQSRGIPHFAASQHVFDLLNDYFASEAAAAVAASKIALYIKRPPPDLADQGFEDAPNEDDYPLEDLRSATIEYLREGEEIQPFVPQRPGVTFEPFVVRLLRGVAASVDLPYEMVVKDFGRMNYSSARVALLEARRGFLCLQAMINRGWNVPWYANVIAEGVLRGMLPDFGFFENPVPFLRSTWIPPAWDFVDPTKEIQASADAVTNNLSTPQREASRNGMDLSQVFEQKALAIVTAREVAERHDVRPEALMPGAGASPMEQQPGETGGAGDDRDPEEPDDEPEEEEDGEDEDATEE